MDRSRYRQLFSVLRSDSDIAPALPEVKQLALRAFAWLMVNELLLVAEIYPVKLFIDTLNTRPFNQPKALVVAAVMTGLYLASTVVRWFMDIRRERFYRRVWSLIWGYGHRVEQRQSVSWHKKHSTGDKESVMTKNVDKIDTLIDEGVFEAAPSVIRIFLTALGVGLFIDWRFGLLALVTITIFVFVSLLGNQALAKARIQTRRQQRFLERFGTEMTTNWRTLKYFGMERHRCDQNQAHLDGFYLQESNRFRLLITTLLQQEMVVTASRTALWVMVVLSFATGAGGLGTAVLVLSWMERIYSNFYRLSSFERRLNETWEPFKELVGLVLNLPEVRQPDNPQWPGLSGRIQFDHVSFTYSGNAEPDICDFCLTIEPNQTIAVVGKSGCGKTTLMELLMRSYDPDTGAILLDDVDLRQLDYDRYRQAVAIVNQDVQLFDMSVFDNIRFARLDATDLEVVQAAKLAYADQFIRSFPAGYDTLVGEDGILLSGGQKQRIAIARALLRNPRILVLDEATSSLDPESQNFVKRAIDQRIAERACTTFVIAHRLSTVREADWIVVMKNGRIDDVGSHQELMRRNGFYRRMCELESQGILDEH